MHRLKEFMEKLEECAKCEFDKGIQNVDTHEMGAVLDMIKDCTEAMYYYSIVKAMKEQEDDDEDEDRKYYRGQRRDSRGRFMSGRKNMRRGYEPDYHMPLEMGVAEYWRDMDLDEGRMYYTEGGNMGGNMNRSSQGSGVRNTGNTSNRGRSNSRYGYSHDEYMKKREMYSKDDPEDKKKRTEMLNEYMDDLSEMAKEMIVDMSPEEKQMWKVKLNKLINM